MAFTSVTSSAIFWKFGTASLIQSPPWPYCLNVRGLPMSFGTPVVNAKVRPLRKESGQS